MITSILTTVLEPAADSSRSREPNAVLEEKVEKLVQKAKAEKNADPVMKVASMPKIYDGVVRAGTPIYVKRSRIPVVVLTSIAVGGIGYALYQTNLVVFAFCVLGALLGYDLLSGFLHIVFDDPANLDVPILGQPCLEFQMHHYFPTDLVQRDLLDVLGDLNTVATLLAVWTLGLLDPFNNPILAYMSCLKLLTAYYGQLSHRLAHTPSSEKSPLVQNLRSVGMMIPLEKHRSHHRPPHDRDFCLIGVCNPIINFLYHKITRNRIFWMIGFFALALGGIPLEAMIMEKLLHSVGIF